MTSPKTPAVPITDEEIEELERPRNLQKLHDFAVVESLLLRVRADAAEIARLRRTAQDWIEQNGVIAIKVTANDPIVRQALRADVRLRDVKDAARLLSDTLDGNGHGLYQVVNHGQWETTNRPDVDQARDRLRRALAALEVL